VITDGLLINDNKEFKDVKRSSITMIFKEERVEESKLEVSSSSYVGKNLPVVPMLRKFGGSSVSFRLLYVYTIAHGI